MEEDIPKGRISPDSFKWQPKFDRINATKIKTCRNSVQGKTLIADERGQCGMCIGVIIFRKPRSNGKWPIMVYQHIIIQAIFTHNDLIRVPTAPGKPEKMAVPFPVMEISWKFKILKKYHGKMKESLEK